MFLIAYTPCLSIYNALDHPDLLLLPHFRLNPSGNVSGKMQVYFYIIVGLQWYSIKLLFVFGIFYNTLIPFVLCPLSQQKNSPILPMSIFVLKHYTNTTAFETIAKSSTCYILRCSENKYVIFFLLKTCCGIYISAPFL